MGKNQTETNQEHVQRLLNMPTPSKVALTGSMIYEQEQKNANETAQKYMNIHSMTKNEKIETLKDTSLDPSKLVDGYDALSNSNYSWKQIGTALVQAGKSEAEKNAFASVYYDNFIVPSYQKLGARPIDKKLWMHQAFNEGLKYNIEDSYHSSLVHGVLQGIHGGTASIERAAQFVTDIAGYGSKLLTDRTTNKDFNWTQEYYSLMAGMRHSGSLMGGVEERIKKSPTMGPVGRSLGVPDTDIPYHISKMFGDTADSQQFMADIVPNQDVVEKATSFVTEQAMMTPLYMAAGGVISRGGQVLGAGSETLTGFLNQTPHGKAALGLLKAGGEGGLIGITARSNEEKKDAWMDVLSWMAMHTMFSAGTKGLGITSMKLGEILKGKAKDNFDKLDAEYRLNEKGFRFQNKEEVQKNAEEAVANSMVAGGGKVPYYHYKQAEDLIRKAEAQDLSYDAFIKVTNGLIQHDAAYWTKPVAAAKHIFSILNNDFPELEKYPEEGSSQHTELWNKINSTIETAANNMHEHVVPLAQAAGEDAVNEAKGTKTGQATIATLKAKFKSEWESSGHKPKTDEEYQKIAEQQYAQSASDMAKESEKVKEKPAVQKASEAKIEAARIAQEKRRLVTMQAAKIRQRQSYFYDSKGRVKGYSLSLAKDYNVHVAEKGGLKKPLTGAAWNSYLKKYLTDLSPEDFAEDLNDYWLPKVMQEEKVHFESEHIKGEGKDYPNLLAFAYNFRESMPAPLRAELETRYAEQPKLQAAAGITRRLEPKHMDYFADVMMAHVDEFFRARGLLKDQTNIWRSSFSKGRLEPTDPQIVLQKQVSDLEIAEIRAATSGNKELSQHAVELFSKLKKLQEQRLKVSLKGAKDLQGGAERLRLTDEIQKILDEASGVE